MEDRVSATTRRSLFIGAALAILAAMVLTVLGVAIVIAVVVPGDGLVWQSWRALVDERATAWLAVAVVSVPLTYALRPVSPSAISAWLERRRLAPELASEAAAELRRLRVVRTLPAALGVCVGLGTIDAHGLALAYGTSSAAHELYQVAGEGFPFSPFTLVIAGYLAGVVLAELTRRRPSTADAAARLEVRRPEAYLTRPARWLPGVISATLLVLIGVSRSLADRDVFAAAPPTALAVITAGLLAIGVPAVQWWVVRRPQQVGDPAALALDDTFRSSAAHGVVGASVAGGLGLVLDLTNLAWGAVVAGGSRLLPWLTTGFSMGVFGAIVVVWLRYGTAHPGRRPATGEARP